MFVWALAAWCLARDMRRRETCAPSAELMALIPEYLLSVIFLNFSKQKPTRV